MASLIDNFQNPDLHMAIVTESWMKPGPGLQQDIRDLEDGQNLKMIHNSRPSRRGKTAGGGVAIIYDAGKLRMNQRKILAGKAEIVCATGKLPRAARSLLVFAVYLPPQTRVPQVRAIMETLSNEISRAKTEMNDPMIIIGGDFILKPHREAFQDFPDLVTLQTGPTRGDHVLDLAKTNIADSTACLRPPLESDDGTLAIYVTANAGNEHRFKWKRIKCCTKIKKKKETPPFGNGCGKRAGHK